MAKTYELKNITNNPARPIGLMVGGGGEGINPKSYKQVNTDDIPVTLTAAEYGKCKDAIKRYVDADMLKVKEIGKSDVKKDDVEDIDALREEAKALNIKSWHVMGADKLITAIAEAKAEEEAK